jgi:hypothetical protein
MFVPFTDVVTQANVGGPDLGEGDRPLDDSQRDQAMLYTMGIAALSLHAGGRALTCPDASQDGGGASVPTGRPCIGNPKWNRSKMVPWRF